MTEKTMNIGDEVYLADGHLCQYAGTLDGGQHAVRHVYESDGEPWVSDRITVVGAVFKKAPVEALDARVSERRSELSELEDRLSAARQEALTLERQRVATAKAIAACRPAEIVAAWLAGKVTHFVMLDSDAGPSLRPANAALEKQYGSGFAPADELKVTLDRSTGSTPWVYRIGGEGHAAVPCLSEEEGKAALATEWERFWTTKKQRMPWQPELPVTRCRAAGLPVPDWYIEQMENGKRIAAQKRLTDAQKALDEAKAELAAIAPHYPGSGVTAMTETTALLPCPFCGSPAGIHDEGRAHHEVNCDSCECGTYLRSTEAAAIAAWNRRATPAALSASPAGWRLVPVEPTREMMAAASQYESKCAVLNYGAAPDAEGLYGAMIDAAPPAPAAEPSAAPQEAMTDERGVSKLCMDLLKAMHEAPTMEAGYEMLADFTEHAGLGTPVPLKVATPAAVEALTEALESIALYADEMAEKDAQAAAGVGANSTGAVGALSMYIGGQTAAKAIAHEARRRVAARKEG